MIDVSGAARRIGMAAGNEFSDHKTERLNYLHLAPSKLRQCSLGPELVTGPDFSSVSGTVSIDRGSEIVWTRQARSGQRNMAHSLANIEHHHFKHPRRRRPGDVRMHFFGADAFSSGAGVELQAGDVVEAAFEGFGRPLRNRLKVSGDADALVQALPA